MDKLTKHIFGFIEQSVKALLLFSVPTYDKEAKKSSASGNKSAYLEKLRLNPGTSEKLTSKIPLRLPGGRPTAKGNPAAERLLLLLLFGCGTVFLPKTEKLRDIKNDNHILDILLTTMALCSTE